MAATGLSPGSSGFARAGGAPHADRLVLHIGCHKTGSSAIQLSLDASSDDLRERGVLYPLAGRRGTGHAAIPAELRSSEGAVAEIPSHATLLDEIRGGRPATVVLSSEGLTTQPTRRSAEWARALADALAVREVTVLVYVRPQWQLVESAYADRVRTGRLWTSFVEYLDDRFVGEGFDYRAKLEPWHDAFGERLEVRPYASTATGGDAVAGFWAAAGLGSPTALGDRQYRRERPGARRVEMLRALRATFDQHGLDELVSIPPLMARAHRRIEAELPNDAPFTPLTPELAVRVYDIYAEANEEYVRERLGGADPGLLAPPDLPPERHSTWSLTEATDDERRVFAAVVEDALRFLGRAA